MREGLARTADFPPIEPPGALRFAPDAAHNTRGKAAPSATVAIQQAPAVLAATASPQHEGQSRTDGGRGDPGGAGDELDASICQICTNPMSRAVSTEETISSAPDNGIRCGLRLRQGFSSQPKRSWLACCDNGSRWWLCPTRYLSRPTGEPGGPEGDTPQTEALRMRPRGVRRLTRLLDRRGRPPGPGGVRGAWEMAPRCRSAAQAPVNPGPPEREEEPTMGPDQEGTKRREAGQSGPTGERGRTDDGSRPRRDKEPRPGKASRCRSAGPPPVKPGSPARVEERTTGPDHEGTTRLRLGKAHRCRSAAQAPVNPGPPEREEEPTMGPDQEGTKRREAGQPGVTGKNGGTDDRSRPRRDIHKR